MNRTGLALAFGIVAIVACGGSTSDVGGNDGGTSGDGGTMSEGGTNDGGGGDAARDSGRDASPIDAGVPINHRPDDSQCRTARAAGNCQIMGGPGACHMDSDCTMGTNGRCSENMGGARICYCAYDACMHDADCATGKLCVCHGSAYNGGAGNACVDGNCRVDADCGASGYCSPSHGTQGCGGVTGYYCHTAADTCVNDNDCMGGGIDVCAWSSMHARWECQQQNLCP